MRPFQYLAPQGLDEALALLTQNGAVPLAGGTDLFLGMERRQTQPEAVVDLKRIPGMDGIEPADRGLRIGALALMETLSASFLIRDGYPALGDAARVVGSSQTRNRATIGGNLANASPAADTATPLMALGAVVEATGADGTREIPIDELFRGPGKTALRDGELLTAILIPPVPALSGGAFSTMRAHGHGHRGGELRGVRAAGRERHRRGRAYRAGRRGTHAAPGRVRGELAQGSRLQRPHRGGGG